MQIKEAELIQYTDLFTKEYSDLREKDQNWKHSLEHVAELSNGRVVASVSFTPNSAEEVLKGARGHTSYHIKPSHSCFLACVSLTRLHQIINFISLLLIAGLLDFGWARPSLCSTAMSMACRAPSLRRWKAVSVPWSIPRARESYPAALAPPPPPVPHALQTTQPAAEPVTTATFYISVPVDQASPRLWTTTWALTWTCLMLRYSNFFPS